MIATYAAAALSLAILVIGIPYVFIKHLGWGILRCGRGQRPEVALTFDDGPDPIHTPRILETLAKHDIPATFFVSGDAADRHPDLVRRAASAGHEIGSHSYRHLHALFQRPPVMGYFDTILGIKRLEALLRRPSRYFRPPWGAYSWSVLLAVHRVGVAPVHWTVEAHDWHRDYGPERVVEKVLREVRPGSVIVMHDGPYGGANAAAALDAVLHGLAVRGLRPVPLASLKLRTGFPWPRFN